MRLLVLVSNDLVHDQRVRKVCDTLGSMGFVITLIGRKLANSEPLKRPYETRRFRLFFTKGVLFYAALNIRLFFYLLFARFDVVLANDLDTLLPAYIVARLRKKELVYDSHEYFTESAGLTGRSFQKKVWTAIEGYLFPRLKNVITVNQSIAGFYQEKYGITVHVVRNIPPARELVQNETRTSLGLPADKKIILLQGAYIDVDRGAKEAALAMAHIEGALLLIVGAGQEIEVVREIREREGLQDKIMLLPKLPFDKLMQYTMQSDLGLSLDKDLHLNYKYSLPNKLFDYIQCGLPVLTSSLPELERIHAAYEIGLKINNHDPVHIAQRMEEGLKSVRRPIWKENLSKAAAVYTWEHETEVLVKIYKPLLLKHNNEDVG